MIINNKEFKIFDCTLRDGGYYTNWDFPVAMVEKYLKAMNQLPVDYVELGYRSLDNAVYHGEYNYLPKSVLEKCKEWCPDKKRSVMINLKEVDEQSIHSLIKNLSSYVHLIRFATRPEDVEKAIRVAKVTKSYGLKVALNIMYMSTWVEDPKFADHLQGLEDAVDYLVMVDSYGSVFPQQIQPCVEQLRKYFKGQIGFHGHNNLELAFANTLAAIDAGVEIVDATMKGMGRGAGNLKMELLLTYCAKYDDTIALNVLMETLEDFELLHKEYNWGTNLPYIVSGCNSLPQKDIMEWITKKRYSAISIVQRLQTHIKPKVAQEVTYPLLPLVNEPNAVTYLIGGGQTIPIHIDAILELIRNQSKKVRLIFSSAKHLSLFDSVPQEVERYIYLVGIEGKRIEKQIHSVRATDYFVVMKQRTPMEMYVPASISTQLYALPEKNVSAEEDEYRDSPLFVSLEIAQYFNTLPIYLLGYDGYEPGSQNDAYDLMEENQRIIDAFSGKNSLYSLLPTRYQHIKEQSLYSLLAL
ncbi:MAG: aldolase catalytic domain-containing protein [Paludibacteraceae bacterium]|nr:aldolase catalytic domain-containing protein [Paludibacteraceae bacterium]